MITKVSFCYLPYRMNAKVDYKTDPEIEIVKKIKNRQKHEQSQKIGNSHDFVRSELAQNYDVLAINPFSYSPGLLSSVGEPINGFYIISFSAMVPKAGNLPSYQYISYALTGASWIFVLGSIFAVTLVRKIGQYFYNRKLKLHTKDEEMSLRRNLLYTFQTFLGDTLTKLPNSNIMRLILLAWIFYSFLVTSSFTAKLLSSLISPRTSDQINTQKQLFASDLRINAFEESRTRFMNASLPKQHLVRFHFIPYSVIEEALVDNYTNDAYVTADYVVQYFVAKYYDRVNQGRIFI